MDMISYLQNVIDLRAFVGSEAASGVRYNPLKISRAQFLELMPQVRQAPFFAEGCVLTGQKEGLGKEPLHMAGGCYFQEPSAMSAITALGVQNGERVLDMCAAPGSKATAIAAQNPDGILVMNEIHPVRAKILVSNLERMGVANALITRSDAAGLTRNFAGYFDKILLDAPCSGEGMFRKYPEILKDWTQELVQMCAERSAELLESAAVMLRGGGRLVYSTCTFNLEENEKNVLAFLQRHPEFEVVDTFIAGAQKGLLGLEKASRIFPSENAEGHFVCAMQKRAGAVGEKVSTFAGEKPSAQMRQAVEQCVREPLRFYGKERPLLWQTAGQSVFLIPADMPRPVGVQVLRAGVQAAVCKGKTLFPCHHLFMASPTEQFLHVMHIDDARARTFLSGGVLESEEKGYTAVLWRGLCLGFGKASGGTLKNHYPKGLRI